MPRKFILLLVFVMTFLPALRVQSAELAVRGIKLGMSVEEAKKEIGVGFTFDSVPADPSGEIKVIVAERSTKNKERYVLISVRDKLLDIQYIVDFSTGNEPRRSDFISGLTEKYGAPVVTRGMGEESLVWSYDEAGDLTSDSSCKIKPFPPGIVRGPWQRTLKMPQEIRERCNKSIKAKLAFEHDRNLVSYYEIWMWDEKGVMSYRKDLAHQKEESAKKNKPPLL